jgi:5'-deoxynucleotidase YfbR-like HD superfamily hydrolase
MPDERLASQIAFLVEADRLKTVFRRTPLVDLSRQEYSAEHSWHMMLAAIVAREYLPAAVDLVRVFEMIAAHDLVEIDAGDTFAYDAVAHETKAARERAAAWRIFGLLPAEQGARLRALAAAAERILGRRQLERAPRDARSGAAADGAHRNRHARPLAVRARADRGVLGGRVIK